MLCAKKHALGEVALLRDEEFYPADKRLALASMTLATPYLPSWHHVPPRALRLIWNHAGRIVVHTAQRAETLSGSRMVLLEGDTRYEVMTESRLATYGQLDLTALSPGNALKLPEKLRQTAFARMMKLMQEERCLPFVDSQGVIRLCLTLLRGSLTDEKLRLSPTGEELLLATILAAVGESVAMPGKDAAIQNGHVKQAVAYLQRRYTEELDTERLAEAVHLHPNYLHRIFRAEMHCTIGEYLLRYRMEQARKLLVSSDITVAAAGRACGVPNEQQFSKLFKKVYGQSPRAYSRQLNTASNFTRARDQFGVINYAAPERSRPINGGMHLLGDALYRQADYVPVVVSYSHYADLQAVEDVTDHAHPLLEIMYVQEGEITVVADGTPVTVRRGEYIWLDAGVRHQLMLCHDQKGSMLNIELALMPMALPVPTVRQMYETDPAYAELMDAAATWLVLTDVNSMMGQLMNQMVMTASMPLSGNKLGSLMAQECLCLMAAQRRMGISRPRGEMREPPAMHRVDSRLMQLYAGRLSVGELASACQMTVPVLQRLIRQSTGLSANEYIQHYRMKRAQELLAGGVSVSEAACQVGYQNEQYFRRLFKQMVGETPGQFCRQSAQKKKGE